MLDRIGWTKEGDGVLHNIEFEEGGEVAVAGGKPRKAEVEPTPKAVKSSSGSVFSEGEAPSIVGAVPTGWRVETSNDIKVKFGPHKVPVGDDITFVVPVYTLVPEDDPSGVYIIEPGRTKDGHDEGGTLAAILSRLDGEAVAVKGALASLSDAIAMLPRNEKDTTVAEGETVGGVEYQASVPDDKSGKGSKARQ